MELELRDGDYVPDGMGGVYRKEGKEALLQRVLFRLTARRGQFPFWENLGSRLWQLGRLAPSDRQAAAKQFVAEALAEENVTVESVQLMESEDNTAMVHVSLSWMDEPLEIVLNIRE